MIKRRSQRCLDRVPCGLQHQYGYCYTARRIVEVLARQPSKGGKTAGYTIAEEVGHFEKYAAAFKVLLNG
jgi:hypothetical protein